MVWEIKFVVFSRRFFSRTNSRRTTVFHVRNWTPMLTRTTLVTQLNNVHLMDGRVAVCPLFYSCSGTPFFPLLLLSALNAQAALSQVRERQLAAQSPAPSQVEVNGAPSSSQASGSVPQPRPEHCEGAAAGGRALLLPPAVPPPATTPSPPALAPTRPPVSPQSTALRPVLQEAEEAILTKLRWATTQLQCSTSLEASVQLCNLIASCANSLRSLKELNQ